MLCLNMVCLTVASPAGTSDWNEGSLPDVRGAAIMEREGLKVRGQARTAWGIQGGRR
jgi:hypothetical protein